MEGTFFHMWWYCKKAKKIWIGIHSKLQEICQKTLDFSPKFFLLNIIPSQLSIQDKHICLNIITAARICYARKWKKEDTPMELNLISKILQVIEMDVLTDKLNGSGINMKIIL